MKNKSIFTRSSFILSAASVLLLGSTLCNAKLFLKDDSIRETQFRLKEARPTLYKTSQFGEFSDKTHTPVIGIVTQTLETEMQNLTEFKGYRSYIMKSYVDFLEAAGARIVPLIVGEA